MFSENYRGVGPRCQSGDCEEGAGYDRFFRSGWTRIRSGSHSGNILTCITRGSPENLSAIKSVTHILQVIATIRDIRTTIEPVILVFQNSCRQLGATASTMFPKSNVTEMMCPGLVWPLNTNNLNSWTHDILNAVQEYEALSIFHMTSLMMTSHFGCRLPNNVMFLDVGSKTRTGDIRLRGYLNRGECYTSLHSDQIVSGVYSYGMKGLCGVPHDLEVQIGEAIRM